MLEASEYHHLFVTTKLPCRLEGRIMLEGGAQDLEEDFLECLSMELLSMASVYLSRIFKHLSFN
jgi:hypothetical protein